MKNIYTNIFIASMALTLSTFSFGQTENTRPNIVFVFVDDLGYSDVGFNRDDSTFLDEYGKIPTPEMDAMAANGVIAKNAHVAHPFCGPSRAALMTGMYPHRIGTQYNLLNSTENPNGIPTNETYFSNILQDNNYNTAAIGKWHLGVSNAFIPNNRGFDYFFGMLGGGHQYFESDYEDQWINNGGTTTNEYRVPLIRNNSYVDPTEFQNDEYLTDILTDEAVNYINNNATDPNPFFMYLAYNAPHTPLQAPQAKIDTFNAANGDGTAGSTFSTVVANSPQILGANIPSTWTGTEEEYRAKLVQDRLTYAVMVSIVDEGIGAVKNALVANGILDNTLFIFMSDNGGKRFQAGAVNIPLQEGKGSVNEGGHRVPMFFHWPDQILTGGQTYNNLISSLDLYPTFVSLAGASIPANKQIDGTPIMDAIVSNSSARANESLYIMRPQLGFHNGGILTDDFKLTKKGNGTNSTWALYDAVNDPGETTNLRTSTDVLGTGQSGIEIIDALLDEGIVWVSDFQDVQPLWYDNNGTDGLGHPHSFLWNDGTLPAYDLLFERSLITQTDVISISGLTNAVEGETDGVFTVSLPSGINADQDIDLTYTVSGEAATDGSDYTQLSGILTILEGTNSTDIIIVAGEDGLTEISETVIIELTSTSIGTIDSTPAEINILDATQPTTLTAGDVAIVGYRAAANNICELAFVILKDIDPGTSMSFSNRGWHDDGTFNTGGGGAPYAIDDVFSWTTTEAHSVGTIFKLGRNGKITTVISGAEIEVGNTVQTFGTDDDWDLSPAGDSVLIYAGDTATHPADTDDSWITGLNTNGVDNASIQNAGWAVGGGNAYCELPSVLNDYDIDVTGGDYALNLWDINHGVYIGDASGGVIDIRDSINDYQNWELNESTAYFLWNSNDIVGSDVGDIILDKETLSINNVDSEDFTLKVFPNPSRDYFNIKLNRNYDKLEIEILSISGQLLMTINPKNTKPKIDASALPSGMYILRVKADNNLNFEKIIKL